MFRSDNTFIKATVMMYKVEYTVVKATIMMYKVDNTVVKATVMMYKVDYSLIKATVNMYKVDYTVVKATVMMYKVDYTVIKAIVMMYKVDNTVIKATVYMYKIKATVHTFVFQKMDRLAGFAGPVRVLCLNPKQVLFVWVEPRDVIRCVRNSFNQRAPRLVGQLLYENRIGDGGGCRDVGWKCGRAPGQTSGTGPDVEE